MATYNPPPELFSRQIESIRNQSYRHWICIISDDHSSPHAFDQALEIIGQDKRFRIRRSKLRLGYYHNFELCLSYVPEDAEFVALSDQDDYWHPDKLETLLSKFDENTTLVCSDMNVVDRQGRIMAATFWTHMSRTHYCDDLALQVMTNSITGAASMFRRSLLRYLFPFPRETDYHDHWIGSVALALGRVNYVNRPLYDYVQHRRQALGHYAYGPYARSGRRNILSKFFKALATGRVAYFDRVLKLKSMASILESRTRGLLTSENRKALERLSHIDEYPVALVWLALRVLKDMRNVTQPSGVEFWILTGVLWKQFAGSSPFLTSGSAVKFDHSSGPEAAEVQPLPHATTTKRAE